MIRKIKLVHVQVLPILSGVQKITLNIFKHLDTKRFEMYLICGFAEKKVDRSLITECKEIGVKVIILKEIKRKIGLHDIAAFFRLLQIFRKYKFDIIHTHTSKNGFLGRIAGKLSGCRNVIHTVHGIAFHDFENPVKKFFFQFLEIVAGQFNDRMVLVNNFYRKKYWFIPARKLVTIYNGIDFAGLQFRKERDDNIIRLISVGRLDAQKSPFDLLRAFKIACQKRNDLELLLVGDGEYFSKLNDYILQEELQDNVKLLGWRFDVNQLLAESDIFISSPIYEAFGLVFCEAGYSGLPVISTEVEGIPEVVENGVTGILVPPRDPEAMSEAIVYLAENEDVALAMGKKAKALIERKFNITRFVKEYSRLYELH